MVLSCCVELMKNGDLSNFIIVFIVNSYFGPIESIRINLMMNFTLFAYFIEKRKCSIDYLKFSLELNEFIIFSRNIDFCNLVRTCMYHSRKNKVNILDIFCQGSSQILFQNICPFTEFQILKVVNLPVGSKECFVMQ